MNIEAMRNYEKTSVLSGLKVMTKEQSELLLAAEALINFVKNKYPGEELYCPYMKALDVACKNIKNKGE